MTCMELVDRLYGPRIGPRGLVYLAELLRKNRNRSLRCLALGNNNVGAEATVALAGGS